MKMDENRTAPRWILLYEAEFVHSKKGRRRRKKIEAWKEMLGERKNKNIPKIAT